MPSGKYNLVKEYTSSRCTTIAPVNLILPHNYGEQTGENESDSASSDDSSFEDFIILLARCKSNIRVLKRVPRAARVIAANGLSQCIEECLACPDSMNSWTNLLTFAYGSLQVPDKVANVSLSTLVKRNVLKPGIKFQNRPGKKKAASLSRRVECKIAEGDVKGAVRILSSTDTLAVQNETTFAELQCKHPSPTREMTFPNPPDASSEPLVVSEKDVFFSIKSFPNGSSSGIDGILPQHLKDLTLPSTGDAGLRLLRT